MRILIVEDEPTLGNQLKNTLEQNGYAIDLSTDGKMGISSAQPRTTMR
jgi:two-component system OmpR family response regulator